jgi:hypothetical protein
MRSFLLVAGDQVDGLRRPALSFLTAPAAIIGKLIAVLTLIHPSQPSSKSI